MVISFPRLNEAHIRPMCQDDLQAVSAIEAATFPNPWSIDALAFELNQNPFCAAFIIELSSEVAGYAFVWVMYDQSHLINIAVAEPFQGHGHGERLLRHVMRYARANGALEMHLEVRETNLAAIALYEKYGFAVRGRQASYYQDGTPALFMQASLLPESEAG